MSARTVLTKGSRNVFADLGFPASEDDRQKNRLAYRTGLRLQDNSHQSRISSPLPDRDRFSPTACTARRRIQRGNRRLPLIFEETMAKLKNVHPGEVLLEEFIVPMSLSQNAVARAISVPPRRINEIVLGKRAVTADSQGIPVVDHNGLAPARYFGTSEQFWMGLQADYDLEEARKGLGRQIAAIERAAA